MSIQSFFEYEDDNNEKYYYNVETQESTYDFPKNGLIFNPDTRELIYFPEGYNPIIQQPEDTASTEVATEVTPEVTPEVQPAAAEEEPVFQPAEQGRSLYETGQVVPSVPTAELGPLNKAERRKTLVNLNPPTIPIEIPPYMAQLTSMADSNTSEKPAMVHSKTLSSKKAHDFSNVDNFELPPDFKASINKFQTPDFARKYFKLHRCRGFFRRKVYPVEQLCSFSTEPIKEPLLSSLPKQYFKMSSQLFDDILIYTGVKSSKRADKIPSHICSILNSTPALRDEIYFQLIKQTTNCPKLPILIKAWQLMLIVSTLYPSSRDSEVWISAHFARNSRHGNEQVAIYAHFCYIRFEARCCLGDCEPSTPDVLQRIPNDPFQTSKQFGVSLYEVMWSQRKKYTHLPFPYIVFLLCEKIKTLDGLSTQGIFRLPGNLKLVGDLTEETQYSFDSLDKANVHDLASLLKRWFRDLPNPLIPYQSLEKFRKAYESDKLIEFVESLPNTHLCTLMYLVGFLQECARHSDLTQMHAKNLAIVFGPNVVQVNSNEPGRIQLFSQMGNSFLLKLIETWDTSDIYPLNKKFLQ